jgi:penicillin-binding protein 1A
MTEGFTWKRILRISLLLGGAGVILIPLMGYLLFLYYDHGLPDYSQLANYEPPVVTRLQAADGSLLAEFSHEKRLFVPLKSIPKRVTQAFLSAEDKNFYSHGGLDYEGIARAMLANVKNALMGRRPVGASTITQQVAKNFLLSGEISISRKVKEAILASRMENTFTKDQILELYLNQIYLGQGSYGVAAAALNYFNKSLDELTVAEAAYLAALPKGPNNYNAVLHYEAARSRRNYVLGRMYDDHVISKAEAAEAEASPLVVSPAQATKVFRADYFTEEIRRKLLPVYGEEKLYEGGLSVRTTLSPRLQTIAERTFRNGLVAYDRDHGWRGPLAHWEIGATPDWPKRLARTNYPLGIPGWRPAVVLGVSAEQAVIGLSDNSRGVIPLAQMKWARKSLPNQHIGDEIQAVTDVLHKGDVIAVEAVKGPKATYALKQIPDVGGALVAMDPHTGRVLAMVGGFDYRDSQFNRATQALRQPGSAFKPFVYAAALDSGYTPSSIVLDAPFVLDQGGTLGKWKPENYTEDYYGPATLRTGIEHSRNLMTVRLAQYIGMKKVVAYAKRFGIVDNMQPTLAMSLGAADTTLLKMTTAYSMLVNGGKRVTPLFIERVQDRYGHTLMRGDTRPCDACQVTEWQGQEAPALPDKRQQVLDPRTAYQIVSMLQGVVERGTGKIIASVGKPLAGKTGTTNEIRDAWFMGFSPDLTVGVYVGFDQPRTLGRGEQGATVAAPIFRDFMAAALKGEPGVPFRIPPGIRLVRVDVTSGQPALASDPRSILEAFIPGTEPGGDKQGPGNPQNPTAANAKGKEANPMKDGTGGLY